MAHTVISAKYPPHIDPTKAPIAYGDRALPRMNRELQDSNLLLRQRAVMSLCDYIHDPEHIASAIREGIVGTLMGLLSDSDLTVRQKSTECLYVMAAYMPLGHAIGRAVFLELGVIPAVAMLFNDPELIARKNAHLTIEMTSETPLGAEGIVESKLVPILVGKLLGEHDEIKELILETLHFCLMINMEDALNSGAMEVFTQLLVHESPVIRAKAARDIKDLSVSLAGKDRAIEAKSMTHLVSLIADKSAQAPIKASAAGAIMTIAITTKGKYTALEFNAIPPLVDLVNDSNSEVRACALKALACLAEAPEGRKQLEAHLDTIKSRCTDAVPNVAKAAATAVKVISWKP